MNEFCDHCGVALELHPDPEREDDENCDVALRKVELMNSFWEPFR